MPPDADAPFARLHLSTPDATADFARRLAPRLQAGDTLLLEGAIGAGKTHFTRALIAARLAASGRTEDIPSPTYTLVQTYDDGTTEIWHADLYRLSGPDEAVELGLSDAFATAICLVEWPDRLDPADAPQALRLSFAPGAGDDERFVTLTGGTARLRQELVAAAGMADA
jgi:tRNA threonylcarbamoyladenosine biosynthesis protein TsaE